MSSLFLVATIATEEALQLQPLLGGRREGPGGFYVWTHRWSTRVGRAYWTVASVWRDRSRTSATPRVRCLQTPERQIFT
jgi:hypothetical protein